MARALRTAADAGAFTLAFTGRAKGESGGPVGGAAELALAVPAEAIADVQELHLALGHLLCELLEKLLVEGAQ